MEEDMMTYDTLLVGLLEDDLLADDLLADDPVADDPLADDLVEDVLVTDDPMEECLAAGGLVHPPMEEEQSW
jgi:hypothetical protein